MRARTINASPRRSASVAWAEVARMVRETLAPAGAIDDADVDQALNALDGIGPTLIAVGVLTESPIVLRALPLQLEITVSLGNAALGDEEPLGKVPGAASAQDWALYIPDPQPYRAQVGEAAAAHAALIAGAAPAEPAPSPATASVARAVDADALRRVSGGAR